MKIQYETNTFYYLATDYHKQLMPESEIDKIDMTQTFYNEIDCMLQNGEIIIININAKMRLGKSTLAMAIAKYIYTKLQEQGYNTEKKFGLQNIARDHQEHSQIMRRPETQYTVIVTDESNELENTGENVTAEKALDKHFSDVQAARMVHRICCSPKETIDNNADILLSVISINKNKMTTLSKLFYRYYEGAIEYTQPLGYIEVDVKPIIYNWETNVKKIFLKLQKTEEEKKYILKQAKQDFYVEYMIKKYEKMELITKEGIMRPRILHYAQCIINTIEKLRKLTEMTNIVTNNLIKNYIKMEFRKQKIPTTMLGIQLATEETSAILEMYKSLQKINTKLVKLKKNYEHQKIDYETYTQTRTKLQYIREEIEIAIGIQTEELQKYVEIKNKYTIKQEE